MTAEVSPERVAFPALTADELERVEKWAERESTEDGQVLFEVGDSDYDFFVVLSGRLEIVERSAGEPRRVTVHRPGEFTGDVDMLTGRPSFVSAVARGRGEVLRVPHDDLRRIIEEVPTLSDKLLAAFKTRRDLIEKSDFVGVSVIGGRDSVDTARMREFLHKNHVPSTWFDPASDDLGAELESELEGVDEDDFPIALCPPDARLVRPTLRELATCIGIRRELPDEVIDVAVVGAGPAGLAAAIFAASEGLRTLALDALGPGGQAGSSSKIENFIGFPSGLSGVELANRAYLQILKFCGDVMAPFRATGLMREDGVHRLTFEDAEPLRARSVILAMGATYRRLPAEAVSGFRGAGLYYSATSVEARMCTGGRVVVAGGGNSGGQAAMYLSECVEEVTLVSPGENLEADMSKYLAERLHSAENVTLRLGCEVTGVDGDERVEDVTISPAGGGDPERLECEALFVFIGVEPNTGWLPDEIALDERGFIQTGIAAERSGRWPLERDPCPVETSMPGVMAAGDVRSGATPRVAFAAGDGAFAVSCVHRYRASEPARS